LSCTRFGYSVSSGGDLNNDTYDDLIVGAPHYSFSGLPEDEVGRFYLFYGGLNFDTASDMSVDGPSANAEYGARVCFLGDVGGDEGNDFAVSYLTYSPNRDWHVAVFYGGITLDNQADVTISQPAPKIFTSISLSSAGDYNHDGRDDLIIGSVGDQKAFLYFGGEPFDILQPLLLADGQAGERYGYAVTGKGGGRSERGWN